MSETAMSKKVASISGLTTLPSLWEISGYWDSKLRKSADAYWQVQYLWIQI